MIYLFVVICITDRQVAHEEWLICWVSILTYDIPEIYLGVVEGPFVASVIIVFEAVGIVVYDVVVV